MVTLARPVPESKTWYSRGWIPGVHRGIDYGWSTEADIEILASHDGTVSYMQYGYPDNGDGSGNGWGNYIKIDHGNGIVTGYAHLKRGSIIVDNGQQVKRGQQIALMGNSGSSSGRHQHFELWLNGTRVDPEPYRTQDLPGLVGAPELSAQQRVFSDYTFRRAAPTRSADKVVVDGEDGVAAGVVGNFTHWTHGESVDGNDIWLKGVSGGWFHSSGLERGTDVSGLAEVASSAASIEAYQRVVRVGTINERSMPSTTGNVLRTFKEGEVLDFDAWTSGQKVTVDGVESDVWFRGRYAGTWFAAACFTSQSTDGLSEVKFEKPVDPTPTPTDPEWKHRTPDSALASWVGSPNFNYREPRPTGAAPTHVTLHWMDGTLAGTDAQFQKGDGEGSSSTYGVGLSEIHQYVREADYQQADGNADSNRWGLSIEHEGGTNRPVAASTIDLSARLLADIAKRYGWSRFQVATEKMALAQVQAFNAANPGVRLLIPHKFWVSTSCPGTLDLAAIAKAANEILAPTVPAEPTPDTVPVERSWLQGIRDKLKQLLGAS